MAASMNRCIYVYVCVYVGWDRSHTHNDEEHRWGNVSHVNRVDDEGYGLARFHVSHVVPRMTPPIIHSILSKKRPFWTKIGLRQA